MGNVPTTVKHCLSHEQLARDYPWLKRWLVEEKVRIFAVSGLFLPASYLHVQPGREGALHAHMFASSLRPAPPLPERGWEGRGDADM